MPSVSDLGELRELGRIMGVLIRIEQSVTVSESVQKLKLSIIGWLERFAPPRRFAIWVSRYGLWRARCHTDLGFVLTLLVLLFAAVATTEVAAADKEFESAKKTFLKDMKRPDPFSRVLAINNFSNIVQPATAEILIKFGMQDADTSVIRAIRTALRQLAHNPGVNDYLYKEFDKATRINSAGLACECLRALAITGDQALEERLVLFLDNYLAKPKSNWLVPMLLIDDFGLQTDSDAVQSIKLMSRVKAFDSHFGYRRCVVQAMSHMRKPEAIDFLIDLIPQTDGLIQFDIIRYLTKTTKQAFRDDHQKWSDWWKNNRESFEFPTFAESSAEGIDEPVEGQLSYYGIPIGAKRIVFVLDTSTSMHGQPIEAAKMALLKAVQALPASVQFDIVLFDIRATTWRSQLVPATNEAKREAGQMVMARELGGATASSAALDAAFRLDPEAIYFISDGKPTDFPPEQIITTVTQSNFVRRISIHAVGLVTGHRGGSELRTFMYPLANQNWGTFRLIE